MEVIEVEIKELYVEMNFITNLSYLDQIHFDGDVLFCMAQEQRDKMLPFTYQAMNLYLGYREENSDIIRYIKNNLNKENLVEELLTLFSQYGLGDLQYKWMIEEVKKEKTKG